jgi:hypothetical protein
MTKVELIEKLATLPQMIEVAETELIALTGIVNNAKEVLLGKEDMLYLNGSIDGKNAEIRNAQLREKSFYEREAVKDAENAVGIARVKLNRLNNELAICRAIAGMLKGVE